MGQPLSFYGPTLGTVQHDGRVAFRPRAGPRVLSVVYGVSKADFTFDQGLKDATIGDFAVLLNGVPDVILSVIIDVVTTLLSVSWTTPGVATDPVVITYTRGTLAADRVGPSNLVASFVESGVIA